MFGVMEYTLNYVIGKYSGNSHGLMVLTRTHCRYELVVFTTHGQISVLLNHTCRRGPNVAFMQDDLDLFIQANNVDFCKDRYM